jgi:hypothetical protein
MQIMKAIRTLTLVGYLFFSALIIFSCKKADVFKAEATELQAQPLYQTTFARTSGDVLAGGVNLTAPTEVNVDQQFEISADISCGRVAIERGYILAADGITKIYKDLTCSSGSLLWEEFVSFQCYTNDASWTGTLHEAGSYVFRTKHNAADGNCDGLGGNNQTGNCSFSGNQFYCFVIEAVATCETSFTGDAVSCGNDREAVYSFTSKDPLGYIKIQGGLTNFTGADAVVTINGGNLVSTQSTPGGSSNRVIKIEGSVAACETITITIRWNSTNSGGIITGDWSVKDANGVEVAPFVAGLTCL